MIRLLGIGNILVLAMCAHLSLAHSRGDVAPFSADGHGGISLTKICGGKKKEEEERKKERKAIDICTVLCCDEPPPPILPSGFNRCFWPTRILVVRPFYLHIARQGFCSNLIDLEFSGFSLMIDK